MHHFESEQSREDEFRQQIANFSQLCPLFTWDSESLVKRRLSYIEGYLRGLVFVYPAYDQWSKKDLLKWLHKEGYCSRQIELRRSVIKRLVKKIIAVYCHNLPLTHLISESGMSLRRWLQQQGYLVSPATSYSDLSSHIRALQSGWIPWYLLRVPEEIWGSETTNILATVPGDIIRVILRNNSIADIVSLARTSRYFDKFCQDPKIWKEHMRDCTVFEVLSALRLDYHPLTEVTLKDLSRFNSEDLSTLLQFSMYDIEVLKDHVDPPPLVMKLPLLVIHEIASLKKTIDMTHGIYGLLHKYMQLYKPEDTDELIRGLIMISGDFFTELIVRLWRRGHKSEMCYWLDSAALETPDLLGGALIGLLLELSRGRISIEHHSRLITALWKRYNKSLTQKQRKLISRIWIHKAKTQCKYKVDLAICTGK